MPIYDRTCISRHAITQYPISLIINDNHPTALYHTLPLLNLPYLTTIISLAAELDMLRSIEADIEDDMLKQRNRAHRLKMKALWALAPNG